MMAAPRTRATEKGTMDAAARQAAYYAATASEYNVAHLELDEENNLAIDEVVRLIAGLDVRTVLDVGSGTGRAIDRILEQRPDISTFGVEPVAELVDQTAPSEASLVQGSALALPFADNSIDVVMETAVLHHLRDPSIAVAEMMRVARCAVFLADSNRFGQGRFAARVVKLLLYKSGLWAPLVMLRTRGRGWFWSEGDGLFYSYSTYDSFDALAHWADRTVTLATARRLRPESWLHPLLTSPHVLMGGIRDRLPAHATDAC